MTDSWENPEFIELWAKYGPGVSPADYIHRFPNLTDPEVAENLKWDIDKQWRNRDDDLTEEESHEIINKLIVGLLFE